jgi:thymidylate synthase
MDLSEGFPLLTTKKLHLKSIVAELLWFLSGGTNNKTLTDQGVSIWSEWALPDGYLGPIYGYQWVSWNGTSINQIQQLVDRLRRDPFSRRHVVSAWNPEDLPIDGVSPQHNAAQDRMALAPCHYTFQVNAEPLTADERTAHFEHAPIGRLSLLMNIRSCDAMLGAPFNIASYALLAHMLAQQTNMIVGDLIISFGDLHLYQNHIHPDRIFLQLAREPLELPKLRLVKAPSIFDYRLEDVFVDNYKAHPHIAAPIAV